MRAEGAAQGGPRLLTGTSGWAAWKCGLAAGRCTAVYSTVLQKWSKKGPGGRTKPCKADRSTDMDRDLRAPAGVDSLGSYDNTR